MTSRRDITLAEEVADFLTKAWIGNGGQSGLLREVRMSAARSAGLRPRRD